MKNPNPSYINITRNFSPILETFAEIFAQQASLLPNKTGPELEKLALNIFKQLLFPADLSTATLNYREPKLQVTKSGPVGETSYVVANDRQHYGRRFPSKPYESTAPRKKHTNRMKSANIAWTSASVDLKSLWNNAAITFSITPKIDGINLFRGIYISLLIDNKPIPDPFIPTADLLHYYHTRKSS